MLRNFTLRHCFFGATNIVKNSDKEKYVYSDYRIAFDGKVEWNFDNDHARNDIISGVDNHTKEILLVLMEALVHQRKSLVLILVKKTQNFA